MSSSLDRARMAPALQQQADASPNPPYNTRDAALRGASLAFGKPPVKPKPAVNTRSGNNGALAAARQSSTPQPAQLQPQGTGNSTLSQLSQPSHLGLPVAQRSGARSPSMIAASLAAARHTPASDTTEYRRKGIMDASNNTSGDSLPGAGTVNDLMARFNGPASNAAALGGKAPAVRLSRPPSQGSEATDASSIQPTTSLVKMFEQNNASPARSPKPAPSPKPKPALQPSPILTSRGPPPAVTSPKPTRKLSVPFASPERTNLGSPKARPVSAGNLAPLKPKPGPKPAPKPSRLSPAASPRAPPKSAISAAIHEVAVHAEDDSDNDAAYTSAPETQTETKERPVLPPPRRGAKKAVKEQGLNNDGPADLPRPSPVPRPRSQSDVALKSPPLPAKKQLLPPPTSSTYKRGSMKQISPHITGESLADAMVGAALAGSRVPTPARSPMPPPPRRSGANNQNHHHMFHHSREASPTKKPAGKLLQTLRKEPSSSDSESDRDTKHKKKRHIRPKHPNKHHEGSRKRWRDTVTEREKKRYEGVWAANRGYLVPGASQQPRSDPEDYPPADDVANVVVRDVWSRSRLPPHVLEEVWELVDSRRIGRLAREEFVVGMWLIDQALKGRKLPVKVQESVWASVRGARVKVRIRN